MAAHRLAAGSADRYMTPKITDSSLYGRQIPAVATVISRRREFANVVTLKLRVDEITAAATNFTPGQFNMLYAFGVGEAAISISDLPDNEGGIVHTIRGAGAISNALTSLKNGDALGVRGPFGTGWPAPRSRDVIIIAGGLGLAPLRPFINQLTQRRPEYRSITLLCGAREPQTIMFDRDLRRWKECDNVETYITVDSANAAWAGNVGLVTSLLDGLTIDSSNTTAFVCGPEIMMRHAAESLCDVGIPNSKIWLSMERNLKCAIGHCGHCQFGPAFVCKDGPVFQYDRIRSNMFVKEL